MNTRGTLVRVCGLFLVVVSLLLSTSTATAVDRRVDQFTRIMQMLNESGVSLGEQATATVEKAVRANERRGDNEQRIEIYRNDRLLTVSRTANPVFCYQFETTWPVEIIEILEGMVVRINSNGCGPNTIYCGGNSLDTKTCVVIERTIFSVNDQMIGPFEAGDIVEFFEPLPRTSSTRCLSTFSATCQSGPR